MDDVAKAPAPFAAKPIAHWTHTLALVAILLLIAAFGHAHSTAEAGPHAVRYSTSILMECMLLGSVIAGIYRRREFFLKAFHHPERSNLQSVGVGVLAYIAGTVAVIIVGGALYFTPLGHKRNTDVVMGLLPHSALEFGFWFGVSATAGICEELIFRGYLMQQLTAWTKRPLLAIALTALLFGGVHLYEGLGAILPLAALGFVYGLFVHYFRGDLRAVIAAHTMQDFLVAVLAVLAEHLKQIVPR